MPGPSNTLLLLALLGVAGCSAQDNGPGPAPSTQVDPTGQPEAGADASTSPPPPPPGDANAPDEVVRFVAVGDTGKGNAGQILVGTAIKDKCAKDGCDFVQLLGDNIYDSGVTSVSDSQWGTKFEQPFAGISLPFWAVLGNHDYGANGAGTEFGKGKFEIDYTQVSQRWKLPAAYYKHREKHLEIFALDTNMTFYGQDAQQKADMKGFIAASTATWKIAVGHHPYLSNGNHGNAGNYDGVPGSGKTVKDFDDEVVCGKVDVLLTAHDHSRQWLQDKCAGTELIVSGAGAAPGDLLGKNPVYHQSNELGFYYFRVEGKKLTAESIDAATGGVDYSRTLTK
jgi:hypothetical protein